MNPDTLADLLFETIESALSFCERTQTRGRDASVTLWHTRLESVRARMLAEGYIPLPKSGERDVLLEMELLAAAAAGPTTLERIEEAAEEYGIDLSRPVCGFKRQLLRAAVDLSENSLDRKLTQLRRKRGYPPTRRTYVDIHS